MAYHLTVENGELLVQRGEAGRGAAWQSEIRASDSRKGHLSRKLDIHHHPTRLLPKVLKLVDQLVAAVLLYTAGMNANRVRHVRFIVQGYYWFWAAFWI